MKQIVIIWRVLIKLIRSVRKNLVVSFKDLYEKYWICPWVSWFCKTFDTLQVIWAIKKTKDELLMKIIWYFIK